MKKSQLRKIIRESIKQLMTEQWSGRNGAQVQMCICDCPPPPIGPAGGCSNSYTCPNSSTMSSAYLTVNGNVPQVGDKIYSDCMPQVFNSQSCTWEITAVGNQGTPQGNRQLSTNCDPKPCPNGMVTQSDPNWGYCAECLAMQPTPSPWPNITGTQCECCDDTPVIEPCKKCCCEKNIMPMEQLDGPIGDPEPSFGGCKPGTEIMLSPTADPCKCPQGMVETPCKK